MVAYTILSGLGLDSESDQKWRGRVAVNVCYGGRRDPVPS